MEEKRNTTYKKFGDYARLLLLLLDNCYGVYSFCRSCFSRSPPNLQKYHEILKTYLQLLSNEKLRINISASKQLIIYAKEFSKDLRVSANFISVERLFHYFACRNENPFLAIGRVFFWDLKVSSSATKLVRRIFGISNKSIMEVLWRKLIN